MLIVTGFSSYAQVDSISVSRKNLLTHHLAPRKSSYCVFSKDVATGVVSQISIWNREVSFTTFNGSKVVVVKQMRYTPDPKRNKYVYTISDPNTLHTIYNVSSRGGAQVEAFNYNANDIAGADSVLNNTKRDFKLSVNDVPFCFEIDLETLSLLPVKKVGQKLAINFYHPGGEIPPKYYPVDVVAEEEITIPGGNKMVCWKIRLRYDEDSYDESWISKSTRELIKLEGHYGSTLFTKIKLSNPVL